MPTNKSNSKITRMCAALALAGSVSHVAAAPVIDLNSIAKTIKCIGASAYSGSYLAPLKLPKFNNGLSGKFMFISDIHIDEMYMQGSDPATMCHRANTVDATKNVAGKYGALNSICDTPQVLLDETFKWMADNTPDVDFIIYTGDSARHDRDTKVNPRKHSEVLNEHKIIVDKVASTFDLSKTKFIPTFGNNDEFDYGKMQPTFDPIIGNLTEIWRPLGLGLDDKPEWKKGGYFSYEVQPGLVVISLNSMFLFNTNKLTVDCGVAGSAGKEMLEWLDAQLANIRKKGKKAYVMQHVPPTDASGKKLYFPTCQTMFTDVIGRNADVVLASFNGHTNSDYISYLYTNNTDNPSAGPFFIDTVTDQVPALDFDNICILHTLSQGPAIIPANNPAIRVYSYSTSRFSFGALLDYVQYWSDLLQDNKDDKVSYETEYTSTKAYGLWNLSPFAWTQALKDWATNSVAFQDYLRFRSVNPENAPDIVY